MSLVRTARLHGVMAGGLLEPGWLPGGFVLINADYSRTGDQIDSVDLAYEADTGYVHMWQGDVSPGSSGTDPLRNGVPLEGTDWIVNPLPERMTGRPGVVEFSTRLEDGRSVIVDSDLDIDTMRRVLESLYLRDG